MIDLAERKEIIHQLKMSIKEVILRTVPEIESIHMGGSSSRNEETHFVHNGRLVLLGNFAYIIFTRQKFRAFLSLRKLQSSLNELSRNASLKSSVLSMAVVLTKPIEISLIPVRSIPAISPDIAVHEIVKNDSLVYGKDMRLRLPSSIPLNSAVKIVLNRLAGLSLCAKLLLEGSSKNPLATAIINYESAKGVLASLEAVLVTEGKYLPSYRERIAFWPRLVESNPDLATALPELSRNLEVAAKIRATPDAAGIDPGKSWINSRNLLLSTLDYLGTYKKLSINSISLDMPAFLNYFYLYSNGRLSLRNLVAASKRRTGYYIAMIEGVKTLNDKLQLDHQQTEKFASSCRHVGISADRNSGMQRYLALCAKINLGCTRFELEWIDQRTQVIGQEKLLSATGGEAVC